MPISGRYRRCTVKCDETTAKETDASQRSIFLANWPAGTRPDIYANDSILGERLLANFLAAVRPINLERRVQLLLSYFNVDWRVP